MGHDSLIAAPRLPTPNGSLRLLVVLVCLCCFAVCATAIALVVTSRNTLTLSPVASGDVPSYVSRRRDSIENEDVVIAGAVAGAKAGAVAGGRVSRRSVLLRRLSEVPQNVNDQEALRLLKSEFPKWFGEGEELKAIAVLPELVRALSELASERQDPPPG